MAKDLKLTTDSNFELANNDLQIIEETSLFVRQKLQVRLRFFRGEWYLDTTEGVPYYQDILKKQPDITLVNNIFRQVILQTPGVESIDDLDVTYNSNTRTYSLSFKAFTISGDVVIIEEEI